MCLSYVTMWVLGLVIESRLHDLIACRFYLLIGLWKLVSCLMVWECGPHLRVGGQFERSTAETDRLIGVSMLWYKSHKTGSESGDRTMFDGRIISTIRKHFVSFPSTTLGLNQKHLTVSLKSKTCWTSGPAVLVWLAMFISGLLKHYKEMHSFL